MLKDLYLLSQYADPLQAVLSLHEATRRYDPAEIRLVVQAGFVRFVSAPCLNAHDGGRACLTLTGKGRSALAVLFS
jgi:hypothetical protein